MSAGTTVSRKIPYGRQSVDDEDIAAVCDVLRSDWLTTGPAVARFETEFAAFTGASHAVAVSSGTAALHAAYEAAGIGPGDEVVVPAMTFAASANAAVYLGARPVFCDVNPNTLLIDPADAARKLTDRTKAIVAVDYAGQPCDYPALREIAGGRILIADACHSLGATAGDQTVGTLADLTAFSFHPVKHITTGEGGMVTTANEDFAARMRRFRNHGIDTDHRSRGSLTWYYSMQDLGFNYRINDFQCALGISQLRKLPAWLARRREIAARYDRLFAGAPGFRPLARVAGTEHAFHLYVVALNNRLDRAAVFARLQSENIGVNVHYIPVHLHPYYQRTFATGSGQHPVAESAYERILSLPMFPGLSDEEVDYVAGKMLQIATLAS